MIIHATKKLTARLPEVSNTPLAEDSPMGSWHAHLYHIDRRQCILFCHDSTRFVLFLPGVRKPHFAALGNTWFRQLYLATLQTMDCPVKQLRKAELCLGSIQFDVSADRSVQGSMRVAAEDLHARVVSVPNVMLLDPLVVSAELNHRPATVYGKLVWPDRAMLAMVMEI